jgi:SAM-dependent methyltransferase
MSIYDDGTYLKRHPSWHQEDSPYKEALVLRAVRRAGLAFESLVDVGCGAGEVTHRLARRFPTARCTGCDVSKDLADAWRRHPPLPNLTFRLEAVESLEPGFDLVLCLDVFEHVEDYLGFLRTLLAKGRRFVFNVPLDLNVAQLTTGGLSRLRRDVGHLHYFSKATALETLRHCGYEVTDWFYGHALFRVPPRNLRQVAGVLPRVALSVLGPGLRQALVGGSSLVVVASSGSGDPVGADRSRVATGPATGGPKE